MADSPDLSELVRRTMEANARFYQGWVDLSVEYFRGITAALAGSQSAGSGAVGGGEGTALEESAPGAVILEAAEGETATGAFLVTNDLGRTLECELMASEIADADGVGAPVRVDFEPAAFDLEPGEQKVVRASVPVAGELDPGVAYSGTFGINGLEGFAVPVVLRRTHAVHVSPIDQLAGTATKTGKAKSFSGGEADETAKTAKAGKTATTATTAKSATAAKKKATSRGAAAKKKGGAGAEKGGGGRSSSGKGAKEG